MEMIDLVTPEHRQIAAAIPAFDPTISTVEEQRAAIVDAYNGLQPPVAVPPQENFVPGPAGAEAVRILVHRPRGANSRLPVLLHIHGGGYVSGTPDMCNPQCERLAKAHGALVVSIDYRLAPEAPFPAGLEDCYAATMWVAENADALGADADRIAVIGESAGGGLAAALAILARDRGDFSLTAQFLIYSMLDHRTGTDAAPIDNPYAGHFLWSRAANRFGWSALSGGNIPQNDQIAYYSPACATDLSDLPPAYMAVGSIDLFVDEDVEFATRLTRAGVPVDLHVYSGGIHGFDMLPGAISDRFRADLDEAIGRLVVDQQMDPKPIP